MTLGFRSHVVVVVQVYFDPPDLGWEPYFKSWVEKFLPQNRQQDATWTTWPGTGTWPAKPGGGPT